MSDTTWRPDPRQGTVAPTAGTPARRPASIRRTTTVDSTRPAGFRAPLAQLGRARDLATTPDGDAVVVADAEIRVRTELTEGPVVASLTLDPEVPALDTLVGRRAAGGFRAAIDASVGAERGSLEYLLLDEIPGATLVSGFAMAVAAERGEFDMQAIRVRTASQPRLQVPDLCAGWQAGGTLLANLVDDRPPMLMGPAALPVTSTDDPDAWHTVEPMPAHAMRRARRIDVWRDTDADGLIRVDVFFRDSHMAPDGNETVVHEYTVDAAVDPVTMTFVACEATPRVLPWRECPEAIGSAGRLVGLPVLGLRPEVRTRLVGPSTCTHLNDVLRGLEDVDWLTHALP